MPQGIQTAGLYKEILVIIVVVIVVVLVNFPLPMSIIGGLFVGTCVPCLIHTISLSP